MKPYLLNPNGESEQQTVSLFDMLAEYEKPLADRVQVEQAKWDQWVKDAILPSIQQGTRATLLADAGIVVEVDPVLRDDDWFIFSDPAVLVGDGDGDPYAWEYDTIDFKLRLDFGVAGPPPPRPLWNPDLTRAIRRVGPWYAPIEACLHQPVWTMPDG